MTMDTFMILQQSCWKIQKKKNSHEPSLMKYSWSCLRVNVILSGWTSGHLTSKMVVSKVASMDSTSH